MLTVRYIVVHHSAGIDDRNALSTDDFRRQHRARGWADIGYHFVLEKVDGDFEVILGRDINTPGAHSKPHNRDSLGVCIVGNFETGPMPEDVFDRAVKLVAMLARRFDVDTDHVIGHRESEPGHTACPGKHFDVVRLRAAVAAALGRGG